ncbi:MAG: VOC family protein [Pyrinomonadaceae bacterium]|nr:VOC family protein [Phycisphaerales bacterium]
MPAPLGAIGWVDLTVEDATTVSQFYRTVCDWSVEPVDMRGYSDYVMNNSAGTAVAGVCHARGPNADIPPQWLMYVSVADVAKSVAAARASGGRILREPTSIGGYGTMAVIQDPAGAVIGIIQPPPG